MSEGRRQGAGNWKESNEHGGKGGQSWREGKALVMSNNKGRRNGKVWNKEDIFNMYLLSNPGFAFYQNWDKTN